MSQSQSDDSSVPAISDDSSGAEPEAAVVLDAVSRDFRVRGVQVSALRDVALQLPKERFIAVTGPSGSGKTTMLNLIGGIDAPKAGTITVLGTVLAHRRQSFLARFRCSHIGFVFQEPHLLPGLSAVENVMVGRPIKARRRARLAEARDLLASVGLADRALFPPGRLSGGERQRVGIARALLGRPSILLADEPTGNLDDDTADEVMDLVRRLHEGHRLTVIMATHDERLAAAADLRVRLNGGVVAAVEGLAARRDHPAD